MRAFDRTRVKGNFLTYRIRHSAWEIKRDVKNISRLAPGGCRKHLNVMTSPSRNATERAEREAQFHDQSYDNGVRERASKYYVVTRTSRTEFSKMLLKDARGKHVLEYGCGLGSYAFELAAAGARVTGIDISPFAISRAKLRAKESGLEENATFSVMDAEKTSFIDQSFDMVCGTGILHHLDLKACYHEIGRLLRPGGKAFFSEPMGHNPIINIYRALTPKMRTPDEHPLMWADLQLARQYFTSVDTRFYHCLDLSLVPLRRVPFFAPLHSLVSAVDRGLMTIIPPLRRMAWQVTITLSK